MSTRHVSLAFHRADPLRADLRYSDPSNTALLQCSSCGNLLDVYQTFSFQVLLVDLLLFKPRAFRHLLTNRGSDDAEERARERYKSLWTVGSIVVGLDACESPFVFELGRAGG